MRISDWSSDVCSSHVRVRRPLQCGASGRPATANGTIAATSGDEMTETRTAEPTHPGETPAEHVRRVDRSARRLTTPCGAGQMVWRIWGEGPPLVLLHGGHGSWTHWLRNIPVLAEHFTTIVPDLPCYGESDLPPQTDPVQAEAPAPVIAAVLDLIEI